MQGPGCLKCRTLVKCKKAAITSSSRVQGAGECHLERGILHSKTDGQEIRKGWCRRCVSTDQADAPIDIATSSGEGVRPIILKPPAWSRSSSFVFSVALRSPLDFSSIFSSMSSCSDTVTLLSTSFCAPAAKPGRLNFSVLAVIGPRLEAFIRSEEPEGRLGLPMCLHAVPLGVSRQRVCVLLVPDEVCMSSLDIKFHGYSYITPVDLMRLCMRFTFRNR